MADNTIKNLPALLRQEGTIKNPLYASPDPRVTSSHAQPGINPPDDYNTYDLITRTNIPLPGSTIVEREAFEKRKKIAEAAYPNKKFDEFESGLTTLDGMSMLDVYEGLNKVRNYGLQEGQIQDRLTRYIRDVRAAAQSGDNAKADLLRDKFKDWVDKVIPPGERNTYGKLHAGLTNLADEERKKAKPPGASVPPTVPPDQQMVSVTSSGNEPPKSNNPFEGAGASASTRAVIPSTQAGMFNAELMLTLQEQEQLAASAPFAVPGEYYPPLLVTDEGTADWASMRNRAGFVFLNIGDFKLEDGTYPRNVPILKVPDADIDAVQDLGYGSGTIRLSGRFWAQAGMMRLETLRRLCMSRRPLIFISQETGAWRVFPLNVPGVSTAAGQPYQYFFDLTLACVGKINEKDANGAPEKMLREFVKTKLEKEKAILDGWMNMGKIKSFASVGVKEDPASSRTTAGYYYDPVTKSFVSSISDLATDLYNQGKDFIAKITSSLTEAMKNNPQPGFLGTVANASGHRSDSLASGDEIQDKANKINDISKKWMETGQNMGQDLTTAKTELETAKTPPSYPNGTNNDLLNNMLNNPVGRNTPFSPVVPTAVRTVGPRAPNVPGSTT